MRNWISVSQAADRYTLSAEHLRYLARTGLIEAQRFGQTWGLDEDSLLAYLATERKRGRKPRQEGIGVVANLRPIVKRLHSYCQELVEDGVFEERWQESKAGRWLPEPRLRQLDSIIQSLEKELVG